MNNSPNKRKETLALRETVFSLGINIIEQLYCFDDQI